MRGRNGRVILTGRWRDVRNHYEAYIQVSRESRSAFLDVVRDGMRKTLAYGVSGVGLTIPSIENEPHVLQFTLVGSLMGLYLDGVRLVEASDSSFDRGTAGVGVQYNSVYFDNIAVERAKVVGPTAPTVRSRAAGAGQVWRFLMGTFSTEAEARRFQSELITGGYLNVSVEPSKEKWDVLVGAFLSEAEAQQEQANLQGQGIVISAIVVRSGGATQYAPVARRRPLAPERVFTLRLGQWGERQQADAFKRKLELDGFFGSEVRQVGTSTTLVFGSFLSREDAEKYRRLLEGSNYKVLAVTEEKPTSAPGPALATPGLVTAAIRQSEIWQTLTAEQKREFERLMQGGATGAVDQMQLYMDLKKELDKLRVETRQRIADLVTNTEQAQTRQRQLAALFSKINKAAFAGNFAEARKGLDEVFALDPDNSIAKLIQQQVELREKTLGQTIEQRLTESQRQQLERTLALAKQRAESFEREGYYQNALIEYENLLSLLREHNRDPQTQKEYGEKIKSLKDIIASGNKAIQDQFTTITTRVKGLNVGLLGVQNDQGALKSRLEGMMKYFPYALGAFGLLALVVLWVFFGVRSVRRRNRLMLEQMQSLTLKPMMEIAGGGATAVLPSKVAPRGIGGGAPAVLESKTAPVADLFPESPLPEQGLSPFETKETKPSPGVVTAPEEAETEATAFLPKELLEPAPDVRPKISEAEEISALLGSIPTPEDQTAKMPASVIPLGGALGEEELGLDRQAPTTRTAPSGIPTLEIEPDVVPLRLDDLLIEGEAKAPAASTAPPVETEATPLDLDMMGVGLPEQEGPATAAFAAGVFYEQSADNEPVGATPSNWKGAQESYTFASLKVGEDTPAPNSTRYLRFEKTEGVGSAYYSCQFPDATGQVAVEFDLRCDQKNKYLLGFYVEKDGDFRQSIHTIVHQPEGKGTASLRVQGEAVSYEMGTWRHIKYVVNLSSGRLSGYVDGKVVLDNIRLTNCPRSLNTLSIRDNIPTTGVLLIDNIRIART